MDVIEFGNHKIQVNWEKRSLEVFKEYDKVIGFHHEPSPTVEDIKQQLVPKIFKSEKTQSLEDLRNEYLMKMRRREIFTAQTGTGVNSALHTFLIENEKLKQRTLVIVPNKEIGVQIEKSCPMNLELASYVCIQKLRVMKNINSDIIVFLDINPEYFKRNHSWTQPIINKARKANKLIIINKT